MNEQKEMVKVVVIGSKKSGKTTLVNAAFNDKIVDSDNPQYPVPSRGADLSRKTIDDLNLSVWTLPGSERHVYLIPLYTRNTSVYVLTVDDENIEGSVEYLKKVFRTIAPSVAPNTQFIIAFTKPDHDGFAGNQVLRVKAVEDIKVSLHEHLGNRYHEDDIKYVMASSKTKEGIRAFVNQVTELSKKVASKVLPNANNRMTLSVIKMKKIGPSFWQKNKGSIITSTTVGATTIAGTVLVLLGGALALTGVGVLILGATVALVAAAVKLYQFAKSKFMRFFTGPTKSFAKSIVSQAGSAPQIHPGLKRVAEPSKSNAHITSVDSTPVLGIKGSAETRVEEEREGKSAPQFDHGSREE